jgi:hypothetical protein
MLVKQKYTADEEWFKTEFGVYPRHESTIAVDFDGVCHSYLTSVSVSEQHVIQDPPVEGALEWITEVFEHFNVVIFTCRAYVPEGRKAVVNWLRYNGFPNTHVTSQKPIAKMYVDDRAWAFDGKEFPPMETLFNYKPWNRR